MNETINGTVDIPNKIFYHLILAEYYGYIKKFGRGYESDPSADAKESYLKAEHYAANLDPNDALRLKLGLSASVIV